jgi:hypothetical protein
LLSILVAFPAAFMPLVAASQTAPAEGSASVERGEPSYKYEVYAGYGYTSLNQVDLSRNGLQGVDLSVTRDWGKYFGITVQGGYYKYPYDTTNPGDPSVHMILAGPELHAPLFGKTSILVHVLLGGEHTGGENAIPNISFAGGAGAGLEYRLKPRIYLRAYGDDIASSFYASAVVPNPSQLGYSAHERRNAHASIGVAYKF